MTGARQRNLRYAKRYAESVLAIVFTSVVGCNGGGAGNQAPLQGEEAVEASAGVAVSTIIALSQFWPRNPGQTPADVCADGGERSASCNEVDGQSRFETTLSDCRAYTPDLGGTIFVDGYYVFVFDDPYACANGPAADAPQTFDVRGYTWRLIDDGGNELQSYSATFTQTTTLRGEGCWGPNQTRVVDGSIAERSTFSGLDLGLAADQLTVNVDSIPTSVFGSPDIRDCAVIIGADGRVAITDDANGRRFGQRFDAMTVTFLTEGEMIDGAVANDCIGNATFETIEPLSFNRIDECPVAGLIKVRFDDAPTAALRFTTAGGVEVDYDDDGQADKIVPSCRDAALAQCAG